MELGTTKLDVLIFGGGASGLWILDRLRRVGYRALLLESTALGAGQTIQAQGIIHGGGRYALRGVKDFAAVQAIREMPDRWRRHLRGEAPPDLRSVPLRSDRCLLWLPRGGWGARLQAWGFQSVVSRAGLLAVRPEPLPREEWPEILRESAQAVFTMAEPVIDPAALLEALAAPHRDCIRRYDPGPGTRNVETLSDGHIRINSLALTLHSRAVVLAAGEGNAALLERFGSEPALMQRRPLGMVLLRGDLPPLFGHCMVGGKVHLTITAAKDTTGRIVWQVGGEIAERLAAIDDPATARRLAAEEIRRLLPGLELARIEITVHRAVRAEARTGDQRRPSGVQISRVAPHVFATWPTKLALVPVLADEVLAELAVELKGPGRYDAPVEFPGEPPPAVAPAPWESAEWYPVPSAAPA